MGAEGTQLPNGQSLFDLISNTADRSQPVKYSMYPAPNGYTAPPGGLQTFGLPFGANTAATMPSEKFMEDHANLETEYSNLTSDYNWLFQRHQSCLEDYKKCYDNLTRLQQNHTSDPNTFHRCSSLVILIDGDDLNFNETLVRAGKKGGERAAQMLRDGVTTWATEHVHNCTPDVKVSVQIFINSKDVAIEYYRASIVASPSTVADFFDGFCQYDALFNVVNVGSGRDITNAKFKALFDLQLRESPYCQIFLGFDRNEDLACMLRYFSTDTDVSQRVRLLRGTPLTDEMAELPFKNVFISGIFQRLEFAYGQQNGSLPANHPSTHKHPGVIDHGPRAPTCRTASPEQVSQNTSHHPHSRHDSVVDLAEGPKTLTSQTGPGGNWSKVASKAAALPFKDLQRTAPLVKPANPCVMQNKDGQRVDAPADYNYERVARLKKMKYCNQHYIGKGCCHWIAGNGACPHRHDAKLSQDDLKWLRVVARETVCKKGTHCKDMGCIYGHHCPYPKNGKLCTNGTSCRFPASMHHMDTRVTKYVTED